jgi:hypothetical protein
MILSLSRVPPVLFLLLAACGRAASTASMAPTPLAPEEAFRCVMKGFQEFGFQRTMYDEEELRTSARRENPKITFSDTRWRKTWDRLDVQVSRAEKGALLEIQSVTEAEYFTQTGKIVEPVSTSKEAQEAAQKLGSRCNGSIPVSPDSVPPASPSGSGS